MKRKMLISIALITIMLLNCIMPIMVHADVSGEEIQLNSKLYKAVKTSLQKQGIAFASDDITHTLTLEADEKAKVTSLNLNEGAISDLTGIEAFSELEHLELSGNNLSKKSNLSVLNGLTKLNYLDLSTNQLEDVSEISTLISTLQEKGTIVLSGQTVTQVHSVFVDDEEESDMLTTAEFELPAILELAGFLKSCWKDVKSYSEEVRPQETSFGTPYIEPTQVPMYVTSEDKTIEVTIADEDGNPYYGLVKFSVYIYDDATEAAQANNPNKASENILNGSRFYLYYVVHSGSSEAITTMDTNLYNAIKEQLTGGQTVNKEIPSYPYAIDEEGNIIYTECYYTTDATTGYEVLYDNNTDEPMYYRDPLTGDIFNYEVDEDGNVYVGEYVNTLVENVVIRTVDGEGNISERAGYKVAYVGNSAGETLYLAAYDEAKTFVIDDLVLTNKITSLILNNKQIRDLSGIEYFIGLDSELNVSHNYLSDIEPVYNLELQKAYWEDQIIEKFNYWLKEREYGNLTKSTKNANTAKQGVEETIETIKDTKELIFNILVDSASLDPTSEDYGDEIKKRIENVNQYLKEIYGYTDSNGEYVDGHFDVIDDYLYNPEELTGLNYELNYIYAYLRILYSLYNNEYKLTTLLADEVNYMTYAEYEEYDNALKGSTESAKAMLVKQIDYLKKLESNDALSELDKELLSSAFGINFDSEETESPLADYFDKYLERTALNRAQVVSLLKVFREIGLYSEMANYCLIMRMNVDTPSDYCYAQEYLGKRIAELGLEEIPADLEIAVKDAMEQEVSYSTLYDVYMTYVNATYEYTDVDGATDDVFMGKGEYKEVDEVTYDYTTYSDAEALERTIELIEAQAAEDGSTDTVEINEAAISEILGKVGRQVINEINMVEDEDGYLSPANELHIYEQLMTLANKIINGNVERYVTLPRLKSLDISYNADLDNLEGITTLTSLYHLNAAYCYIADVTNVDWSILTNLRSLNLGFNYISDISALTNLPNLRTLILSNNLIAGELKISEAQYEKLFKKLEVLDLSGNQITDITSLLVYLDYVTGGNYANYIAQENTIDINLQNQRINLEITEPINIADHPTTIDIELPKIFTQLLAIDTARTAFGETSQNGRVESEGTYVTLNTRTAGDKVGEVVVIPMSGNGSEVDTCVGAGTTATIKYKVVAGVVNSMTVTPSENVSVKAGETLQFTATVEGENLATTDAVYTLEGNVSEKTTISEDGLLSVTAEETAEKLIVKVSPEADKSLVVTIEVTVLEADPENPGTNPENPGTNPENPGTNPENPGTNPENPGTNPENPGTDPENPGTNPEVDVVKPDELGYKAGEEFLTEVKPKTSIEDFKTILLNGKEYNVVIKRDGETITEGNIATGMYVQVQDENGNVVKDPNGDLLVYEVVVNGDVNGDGVANSLDSILIKAYRNEVTSLPGSAFEAADINNDGSVDIADSKLLLYHRAEVKGYDLNYTK